MEHYTQLTVRDRRRLYAFLDIGLSVKRILYLPALAHEKALDRAKNGRLSRLERNGVLRDYVVKSLAKGWCPEQISGRMKHQKLTFYVSPESIYQYIYQSNNKSLYHYLTYKKPVRRRRFARKHRLCRYAGSQLITQRPNDIETRADQCMVHLERKRQTSWAYREENTCF